MLESLLLVCAISVDSFVSSFAYGSNKIKISVLPALILDLVSTLFLAVSLFAATFIKQYIPGSVCTAIGFITLFSIGIFNFFQGTVKAYLKRRERSSKQVRFKLFDIQFALDIYIDETKADVDNSKTLSIKEALYLAVALSIDSLAIGVASGFKTINIPFTLGLCFVLNICITYLGFLLGKVFRDRSKLDLSWLGGLILMSLAVLRVF